MNNLKLICIGIVFLIGCASSPKEIQVEKNQQLVNFANVSSQSAGGKVRWGGIITEMSEQDGVAYVTLAQYPLLLSGQPTYRYGSGGSFTAKFNKSLNIERLVQGSVLTLIGNVEELQNPFPELKSTQSAIVQTEDFYVWAGFSSSEHPKTQDDSPAFIKRGKWGWPLQSQSRKDRERLERKQQE